MNEKKLNLILYLILFASLVFYLYLNVFTAVPASSEEEFCGGRERTIAFPEEGTDRADKTDYKEDMEAAAIDTAYISKTGYHLYIDLDALLMYVYKDGLPIKTYEVSGGKANSPSPLGKWKIISKDTWGEGFGGAWLGFNVPWGLYGIHGTSEPWSIGKSNSSKGCIRMRNKEVQELYKMIPYNTPVTIVYENIPFCSMRDGDSGSDVLHMESALKKLGYYNGSEDGVFGSTLEKSVMKFQKDHGLYQNGIINISTYKKIVELEKDYDESRNTLEENE